MGKKLLNTICKYIPKFRVNITHTWYKTNQRMKLSMILSDDDDVDDVDLNIIGVSIARKQRKSDCIAQGDPKTHQYHKEASDRSSTLEVYGYSLPPTCSSLPDTIFIESLMISLILEIPFHPPALYCQIMTVLIVFYLSLWTEMYHFTTTLWYSIYIHDIWMR